MGCVIQECLASLELFLGMVPKPLPLSPAHSTLTIVARLLRRDALGGHRQRGRRAAVRGAVSRADHGGGRRRGGARGDLCRVLYRQVGLPAHADMNGMLATVGWCERGKSASRRDTREDGWCYSRGECLKRGALRVGRRIRSGEGRSRAWPFPALPAHGKDGQRARSESLAGEGRTDCEVLLPRLVAGLHGGLVGGPHAVHAVHAERCESGHGNAVRSQTVSRKVKRCEE